MKRVCSITLDEEIYQKLRWMAYKNHKSISSIINNILEEELKNIKVEK